MANATTYATLSAPQTQPRTHHKMFTANPTLLNKRILFNNAFVSQGLDVAVADDYSITYSTTRHFCCTLRHPSQMFLLVRTHAQLRVQTQSCLYNLHQQDPVRVTPRVHSCAKKCVRSELSVLCLATKILGKLD